MTVVMVGVGADADHLRPAPKLDSDGRYEYIPIPESHPTTEAFTYDTWELEYDNGTAADVITAIRPTGEDGEWIRDEEEIKAHSPHHDPNFEALTFGDRRGGGGKGAVLSRELSPGDILAFYNGMKRHSEDDLHRYLYGYMTVDGVHDLSGLSGESYRDRLREFPENAHTKRLDAAGSPKHDDLVIVDGQQPAERLETPVRISERIRNPPWHQVTPEFSATFDIRTPQKGIGRKFPIISELDAQEFLTRLRSDFSSE